MPAVCQSGAGGGNLSGAGGGETPLGPAGAAGPLWVAVPLLGSNVKGWKEPSAVGWLKAEPLPAGGSWEDPRDN